MADLEDTIRLLAELLPKHIELSIRHNPHRGNYETVEAWLGLADTRGSDVLPEDAAEIRRTGEIWELTWWPETPVGHCSVAAATLGRCLELANQP